MKNIIVVLVVSVVLMGVSTRRSAHAIDAGVDSTLDVEESTEGETMVFEPMIDDRRLFTAEELATPDSAGIITCSGEGATMRVEIKGNLMIGLTPILPLKMMRRVSLAEEGRRCWGSSLWSVCSLTKPICNKKKKGQEMRCQSPIDMRVVFTNVPRASYVPQIGGYGVFDLKQWKIVGCIREGCNGFCRPGEECRPGPGCAMNGK